MPHIAITRSAVAGLAMRFSQRLELRQGQSLVMTPQLLQAIKLLQFSSLELANYVDAELERNPLLERADDGREPIGEAAGDGPSPDASGQEGGGEAEWSAPEL